MCNRTRVHRKAQNHAIPIQNVRSSRTTVVGRTIVGRTARGQLCENDTKGKMYCACNERLQGCERSQCLPHGPHIAAAGTTYAMIGSNANGVLRVGPLQFLPRLDFDAVGCTEISSRTVSGSRLLSMYRSLLPLRSRGTHSGSRSCLRT